MENNVLGYLLAFIAGAVAILLFLVMSFIVLVRVLLEHQDIGQN